MNVSEVCIRRVTGLTLLLTSFSYAQTISQKEQSLEIGGVELRLGMAQASVLQKLTQRNLGLAKIDLPSTPPDGSWFVCEHPEGATCDPTLGQVSFKGGQLEFVTKRWAETGSGAEVALAIYGAVKDLESRGMRHCEWRSGENTLPRQNNQYVNVLCGGRMGLQISVGSGTSTSPVVVVDEELGGAWNKVEGSLKEIPHGTDEKGRD